MAQTPTSALFAAVGLGVDIGQTLMPARIEQAIRAIH
jgi:hypothetical protein